MNVSTDFFDQCVFISVDFQEFPYSAEPRARITPETLPPAWKRVGITAEDANAATDFLIDVAFPNACRVVEACRSLPMPMIFIHWGYLFRDAIDLDPEVYAECLETCGPDRTRWPHHIDDPSSCPPHEFQVQPGEYVLPKTAQDGFESSNLHFMLRNLQCRHIVFIGGHTNACLGRTAGSARALGYKTLCIEDATFAACESWRLKHIVGHYDHVVTTAKFVALIEQARGQKGCSQEQAAE